MKPKNKELQNDQLKKMEKDLLEKLLKEGGEEIDNDLAREMVEYTCNGPSAPRRMAGR